jgi:hypothetical protein
LSRLGHLGQLQRSVDPPISLSNPVDIHNIANLKSWFKTCTPWASTLGSIHGDGTSIPVLGVDTVELKSIIAATTTLQDVLHMPNHMCNTIGQGIAKGHAFKYGLGDNDSPRCSNQETITR